MRRLILFDIDGTLVRGGPAKSAFLGAMAFVSIPLTLAWFVNRMLRPSGQVT